MSRLCLGLLCFSVALSTALLVFAVCATYLEANGVEVTGLVRVVAICLSGAVGFVVGELIERHGERRWMR